MGNLYDLRSDVSAISDEISEIEYRVSCVEDMLATTWKGSRYRSEIYAAEWDLRSYAKTLSRLNNKLGRKKAKLEKAEDAKRRRDEAEEAKRVGKRMEKKGRNWLW